MVDRGQREWVTRMQWKTDIEVRVYCKNSHCLLIFFLLEFSENCIIVPPLCVRVVVTSRALTQTPTFGVWASPNFYTSAFPYSTPQVHADPRRPDSSPGGSGLLRVPGLGGSAAQDCLEQERQKSQQPEIWGMLLIHWWRCNFMFFWFDDSTDLVMAWHSTTEPGRGTPRCIQNSKHQKQCSGKK